MVTDPIGDFLTRLRNSLMIRNETVECPSSKMKVRIAKILEEEGYIKGYDVSEKDGKKTLNVDLKYDKQGAPVLEGMKRVSKPGLRIYRSADALPKVRGGLGTVVVSTSKGVMTEAKARENKVGGEIICYLW